MIDLFLSALTTATQIVFIHILFWDGMLLARLKVWYFKIIYNRWKTVGDLTEKIERDNEKSYMNSILRFRVKTAAVIACIIAMSMEFIYKPLFGCLICMTSIWGTVIYFMFHTEQNYFAFIFTVGGLLVIASAVVGYASDGNEDQYLKDKE